ncbi:uncharacterized protein [Manis javanica]|uniref:uncharacterized protein n=2 Tax=Manis javanica TaxID=9974 RepID=UPI003C6D0CE9
MRSCCAEPSEGVGVREAKRSSLSARCGRWLSTHLQRFCPCFPRSPEREHESTVNGSEVPKRTAPRTGERRKWRRCTSRVDPAINISRSTPEFTLPPEDADQPTTGQRPPRSRPESVTGDALMASSCNRGHDKRPEEDLKMPKPHPGIRRARRHAWEPAHVPSVLHGIQPSSIPEGRVLHHLVQEEHLGPTVAELEEPRQMQLAPEAQGGPDSSLEPVEDPCETPVLELRPVSPASGPAEPQNIPAVASALVPGPELEPHEPSGTVPGVLPRMALILAEPEPCPESISPCGVNTWDIPGVVSCPELESDVPSECSRPTPSPGMRLAGCHTWEPKHVPSVLHGSQLSSIPEGRVLHHLVQEEHVGPTVAEMEEPRQMQMAPEAQGGPDSSLEPVEDPRETPVLELRPVSPASGPAEPEDVPAVAATPVPGPELQPHEPSGMVPGPLDGMAPGLAEPEAVLEPTSPCAVNTWDVPREEEPTILAFPPLAWWPSS